MNPLEAARQMVLSQVDSICRRVKSSREVVKYVMTAYYLLLCLLYSITYALTIAIALKRLVLLVGVLRCILFLVLGVLVLCDAVPRAVVKGLSKLVKKRASPSSMTEIRAYHGTSLDNLESIRAEGFRPSNSGMLGRGVYVSRDINKVLGYGGYFGVILELRVTLGQVCIVDHQGHDNQYRWHDSYDTAWVPWGQTEP